MFPQFVYQLRLDFYCHSPSARDIESSASQYFHLQKLLDSRNSVICLHAPPETFLPHSPTLQLPCDLWDVHIPAIFEIPGLQQKAGAAHELKPLSIPPVASRNLQDPIFTLGSLGLTRNSIYELTAF